MPAIADGLTALRTLQSTLSTAFATTYAADFSTYGGADVVLQSDEADEAETIGKPCIVLALQSDTDSDTWGFHYRLATVRATAIANDYSGGVQGTANPTPSQVLLSQKLQAVIEGLYGSFVVAGLQGIEINNTGESVTEDAESGRTYAIGHTITFHYRTA